MEIQVRIEQAIQAGEVLRVIYHGGSQPGKWREIAPIMLEDGTLTARCFNANSVRRFELEKLILVSETETTSLTPWKAPQAAHATEETYQSFAHFREAEAALLVSLGWHIEQTESSLSLHGRFKNGKIRKGADFLMYYEPTTFIEQVGPDGELHRANERPNIKPWSVVGGEAPEAFSSLTAAANRFLFFAIENAPNRNSAS